MNYLITGGTGSLGQALTRYFISDPNCFRVVVFSRDEWKQSEMAKWATEPKVRFFLGDVRDRERLCQAMMGVDTVIHAAALKRVDSVSYNPSEVIKTNIIGTTNVIEAAIEMGISKVLIISSDKAVQPANIYGVTKAAAEHYAVASNAYAYPRGTKVSVVRYGNVLGSRGGVIEVWKQAAKEGKPIYITDARCTRFWITMSQAIGLVIKSIKWMAGGEIFIPLLKSMKLLELAWIFTSERPSETGLRPGGEKLHEILISDEEMTRAIPIDFGRAFVLRPATMTWRKWDNYWPGEPIKPYWKYSSDREGGFLTPSEMERILESEGLLDGIPKSDVGRSELSAEAQE